MVALWGVSLLKGTARFRLACADRWRPNGLRVSRAAPIDREGFWRESNFQKSYDLAAAKRRRLHAPVGRQPFDHLFTRTA